MGLGMCMGCKRFARGETCPFCGASVAAPRVRPLGRRNRAGRLVGTAIAAAVAVSCGSTMYGAPPLDSGAKDAGGDVEDEAPATLYGGVPVDSGKG